MGVSEDMIYVVMVGRKATWRNSESEMRRCSYGQ
jgi:hypothetical protein